MQEELQMLNEKLSVAVWLAAAARMENSEHEMTPGALARLLAADEDVRDIRNRIKEIESATGKSVAI